MKSSTKVVLDKINELDSQALNSLRLVIILSLGETPLANALLSKEQLENIEPLYPLDFG